MAVSDGGRSAACVLSSSHPDASNVWTTAERGLLAIFMVAAGVGHLVATDSFLGQVPPWLPARETLIQAGVVEVALGVGLLLPQPLQRRAGWALAQLWFQVRAKRDAPRQTRQGVC